MLYLDRNVSTGKQPGSLLLRGVLEISVRKLRISCCWFWQSFWFWAWDYRGPKGRCPIDRLKSLFGKRLPKGLRVSVRFQKWVPPLNSLDPLRPAAVLLNEPVPEIFLRYVTVNFYKSNLISFWQFNRDFVIPVRFTRPSFARGAILRFAHFFFFNSFFRWFKWRFFSRSRSGLVWLGCKG